ATTRRIGRFPAPGARAQATLTHLAGRRPDRSRVTNDRGDVNRENRAFDDTYWRERNDPAFRDTSIQRYLPALAQALEALKSDPEIRALHDDCVARHRARRDALLEQDTYRDMRAALARASTLPPAEEALIAELGLAP
ncbi:MAG: glycosyltransferase family 2 protein, partial [Pseudomonadota bacterium]|nr:glycosyltransferase family 2 protein [Pseudomonadota bacterium]